MIIAEQAPLSLSSPAGSVLPEPRPDEPVEQLRVVTWNVQHASATRTHQQVLWMGTVDRADVYVLTEVSAGDGGTLLAGLLREFGYLVHLPVACGDYRTLIACRRGTLSPITEVGIMQSPHRALAARITLPDAEVGVVGLYVPSRGPKAQRNVAKRTFQDAVAIALPELASRVGVAGPVVVGGDLNVVEPGHEPHYKVFGRWEYDFYTAFAEAGFADAFRVLHPRGMDHSWFGRPSGDGSRNGYRFDHAFITRTHAHQIRECHYLHTPRNRGYSDHSGMVTTVSLPAPS